MSRRALRLVASPLSVLALLFVAPWVGFAQESPAPPKDSRLAPLKDLDGYFPMTVPPTKEAWEARAEELRTQMKVALGLLPEPTRHPLQPKITKTVDRDGYQVQAVVLETFPGLYLTGSLYLPDESVPGKNAAGKRPATLCPHGHWSDGRFYDAGEAGVRREIASGAERFEEGGRYPLQARCVQLARMGCVVFLYDMLGYADNSAPLSQELVHGFKTQRPELSSPERFGFFSAQAEMRGWSPMGLQTFNSLRAVDFVLSLPNVDPDRIGVTGASGGGTQTMILAALDPRVDAAFPAVMVSTAMQGGCTCESASYLRIGTGNIEFAALTAPRPLGLSGADDWTKEIETKGLPELRQLYDLYGAPKNVRGKYFPFPHNFNNLSRMFMEDFFNEHFVLGAPSPVIEDDYVPLSKEEATVWTDEAPKPASGEAAELALLKSLEQDRLAKELTPEIRQEGWNVLLGKKLPEAADLDVETGELRVEHGATVLPGTFVKKSLGERLPMEMLFPGNPATDVKPPKALVWTDPRGIASLRSEDGKFVPEVAKALEEGYVVYAIDVLHQGIEQVPVVANPRQFAGYTVGYNYPLVVERAHDVASFVKLLRRDAGAKDTIELHAGEGASYWALPAAYLAGDKIDSVSLPSKDERFGTITDIRDVNFLPFAIRYGDLEGLAELCGEGKVTYRE
ncbi:MAG TPA: acetylxylan esterase [Pirellulaceae bacterium]|jgi:hypothetical protein|nr:acetylxylan esterase [Pirellulaceae bacterium]